MKKVKLSSNDVAYVDDADFDLVSRYAWRLHKNKRGHAYAQTSVGNRKDGYRTIFMHRLVMGLGFGDKRCVDHRDHNGLNNCRSNLRVCSYAQNNSYQRRTRGGHSSFRGVFKIRDKWVARVGHRGEQRYLGVFDDEHQAARAYDKAAKQLHGEFATLNFPQTVQLEGNAA